MSYFVVAIRRAWPESSICLSLRSLDIPRLSKIASFVLFSCLEAKVSPTDGKLARTYRVRVQFWCLTRVVLRGRPWPKAWPQGRKSLHLRPSPAISSHLQPSTFTELPETGPVLDVQTNAPKNRKKMKKERLRMLQHD